MINITKLYMSVKIMLAKIIAWLKLLFELSKKLGFKYYVGIFAYVRLIQKSNLNVSR